MKRYGRATFTWNGGDPAVDAARGEIFVALQRKSGTDWQTVGTDDGPEDITVWDDDAQTWTETWQFDECDALGTYRFHVTGHAVKSLGGATEDYTVDSHEFELGPMDPLEIVDSAVEGGTASVRARYPNPGASLLAVPRIVRHGKATFELAGGGEAMASPDAQGTGFQTSLPAGASVTGVSVEDACGNSTG